VHTHAYKRGNWAVSMPITLNKLACMLDLVTHAREASMSWADGAAALKWLQPVRNMHAMAYA